MERKEFIKQSCNACLLIGAGWIAVELAACAHLPIQQTEIKDNKVTMPLSAFATKDLQLISPRGLEYDIAVRKEHDGTYTALLMKCTHADNQLLSTGKGFVCNLHGSTFNSGGAVTQGPAEQSLKRFTTTVNSTDLIININ